MTAHLPVELARSMLGIRSDVSLTPAEETAMTVIATTDLSLIQRRLERQDVIPRGLLEESIAEFRRYLAVRVVHPEPVPMLSGWVDEVWHSCILDSRFYFDLCQRIFGSYLHHEPDELGADLTASWQMFERAHVSMFAEMSAVWEVWRPDQPWFQGGDECKSRWREENPGYFHSRATDYDP